MKNILILYFNSEQSIAIEHIKLWYFESESK